MSFKHTEILSNYENVIRIVKNNFEVIKYVFSNEQNTDYLELYVLNLEGDDNELRIIHDNFPMPRRSFSTNIPLMNIEDFERMFERMNIKLPKRKKAQGL